MPSLMKVHYPYQRYSPILWFLLIMFCLRVIGQILVAFFDVSFLPPMEEWYSGLIPYPYLLMIQILIIILLIKICLDFTYGKGMFVKPNRVFGRQVFYFGYLYLIAMFLRYMIRMSVYPEERWFGGAIPIIFHWVLASFVILFGYYHRSQLDH